MKTLSKAMVRKIDHLRKEMLTNEAFEETFQQFFNIALDENFMNSGKEIMEAPLIGSAISRTLMRLYEKAFPDEEKFTTVDDVSRQALIGINHIESHGMYHGPVIICGGMGGFFYFEKEGTGILSLSFPGDETVWYSRFTTIQDFGDYFPQMNLPDSTVQN